MKFRQLTLTAVFLILAFVAKANTDEKDKERIGLEDLNGVVMDAQTHKPIRDVSVTVIGTTKKETITISDVNGGFSFDDLKPGTYKVVFEKDGYKRITREKVVIRPNVLLQVNIEMESKDKDSADRGPSPWHFFDS